MSTSIMYLFEGIFPLIAIVSRAVAHVHAQQRQTNKTIPKRGTLNTETW